MNTQMKTPAAPRRAPIAGVPGDSLPIREVGSYVAHYNDVDVEARGNEDGAASFGDPGVWGDNVHPHSADLPNGAHETTVNLVGYRLRNSLAAIVETIEASLPRLTTQKATAKSAIDAFEAAERDVLVLAEQQRQEGLAEPTRSTTVKSWVARVALFGGELALVAAAMQIFGLSDTPIIPGIVWSDDLHLFALGILVALNVLGEFAGIKLKGIAHTLHLRRREVDAERRQQLARVSWWDVAWAAALLAVGFVGIAGVADIRLEFFRQAGTEVGNVWAFYVIQIMILAAATALGYHAYHPHAKQWHAAHKALSAAGEQEAAAVESCVQAVALINTAIEQISTEVGKGVLHVGADRGDAVRQGSLYARALQLGQPEPVTDRLLPESLPQPITRSASEVHTLFDAGRPVFAYRRVNMDDVVSHADAARGRIAQLRTQIEGIHADEIGIAIPHDKAPVRALTPLPAEGDDLTEDDEGLEDEGLEDEALEDEGSIDDDRSAA